MCRVFAQRVTNSGVVHVLMLMSCVLIIADPSFERSTYYQPKTKVKSQATEQSSKNSEASESKRTVRRKAVVPKQGRQPNTDGGATLASNIGVERYIYGCCVFLRIGSLPCTVGVGDSKDWSICA